MHTYRIAIGALALLAAAGCGNAAAEKAGPDAGNPKADLSVLHRGGSGNPAVTYETPAEAAQAVSTVAVGTVQGFADGPAELRPFLDGMDHELYVVIEVAVEKMLKAGPGHQVDDRTLYLLRSRGMETYDADGRPGGKLGGAMSPATPVEDFRTSIPVGTRVMVMADNFRPLATETIRTVGMDRGALAGETPLSVGLPHTLLFDAEPPYGAEPPRWTFEEAQSAVEKAVG